MKIGKQVRLDVADLHAKFHVNPMIWKGEIASGLTICQNWAFEAKYEHEKWQILALGPHFMFTPYFWGADSKSGFCFAKF